MANVYEWKISLKYRLWGLIAGLPKQNLKEQAHKSALFLSLGRFSNRGLTKGVMVKAGRLVKKLPKLS